MSEHTSGNIADVLPKTVTRYVKILGKLHDFYTLDGYIDPKGANNILTAMEFSMVFQTGQNLNALDFITHDFLPTRALINEVSSIVRDPM